MNLAYELDLVVRGLIEFPENEHNAAALAEVRPLAAKITILKDQVTEDVLSKEQVITSLQSLKAELDAFESVLPFVKIAAEDLLRFATTLEESE
jgi:hypothetical protein